MAQNYQNNRSNNRPQNGKPHYKKPQGPQGAVVEVRDNNVGQALRRLKKILTNEGVFRELRDRRFYEKPSEKKKKAKAAARKRWQKDVAKRNEQI